MAAFGGLCLQFEGGRTNRQTERQECGQTNTQTDRQTNSALYYIYSYIIVHIFIYFYIFLYISIYFCIQSPLVIVDPVIVESLVIVDRLCRPIVYFSMYFSRNSGITRYSGHFAADGRIHYYERRLYLQVNNYHRTFITFTRVKHNSLDRGKIKKYSRLS